MLGISRLGRAGAALAAMLLAAQAQAQVPYGGDHQTFDGTRIYRIGDYSHRIREFQDNAILGAIDFLLAAGVPRGEIEQITIEPDKGAGIIGHRDGFPQGTTYKLWVKVTGCPKNVFMRAGFTGRLTYNGDGGGCLR